MVKNNFLKEESIQGILYKNCIYIQWNSLSATCVKTKPLHCISNFEGVATTSYTNL